MIYLEIITIILIGLSLSIDAFCLTLMYGLLNLPKKTIIVTSCSIGLFHYFMPLIGHKIGKLLPFNSKYILIIVFIFILLEMIKSLKEEKAEYNLTLINIVIFSFLVSFDSLTVGIGLNYITKNIYLASSIFTIISGTLTYLGFILGKYLNNKSKLNSKIFGIILIVAIIVYLICKP